MKYNFHHFAQALVKQGLIEETLANALLLQAEKQHQSFIGSLLQQQLLPSSQLAEVIAHFFQLPLLNLKQINRHTLSFDLLPEKIMRDHLILPLSKDENAVQVVLSDPTQQTALDAVKFHSGLPAKISIADAAELHEVIESLLSKKQYALIHHSTQADEDPSIINFVQQVLVDAVRHNASDIHFEPYETIYRIRMRIDGVLHEILQPPLPLANRITTRLKVIAKLDVAERRLPQDGRFTMAAEKVTRECRISTCPTLFGEKIVVRILDNNTMNLDIQALGLEEMQQKIFLKATAQPQGMILVTGPTGSGKTVTLYTALNSLNSIDRNIVTVEDPVEINLSGINQVHVNPKIGLSFSTALRAFLRQDPDIIMIGEIRDLETAEIAIRAAQTGHLVLSTLHTNSAAEAITRLRNMGIAPYNLASALTLIISQRLTRKLCPHCKKPQQLPEEILQQHGFMPTEISSLVLFTAGECQECVKGYKGRTGIYEMLPMTDPLIEMIAHNAHSFEIAHFIKQIGLTTLQQSALNKIKQGHTSLAEVNEVLGGL